MDLYEAFAKFLQYRAEDVLQSKFVIRRPQDYPTRKRLTATARKGVANVVFSFSDLKYFFECPYQFKLRILYGFNPPIHEELGFGRSLHNALAGELGFWPPPKDFAERVPPPSLARHLWNRSAGEPQPFA